MAIIGVVAISTAVLHRKLQQVQVGIDAMRAQLEELADELERSVAANLAAAIELLRRAQRGYFDGVGPFADFVVHEVAHIFHNCKRQIAGLPFTRCKEWLLDIQLEKRETFAYSCEAYAQIVERAERFRDREMLADGFAEHFTSCGDERADPEEVIDIVREAATRRNGWKVILLSCAPPRPSTSRQ